ncbi:MAG: hypothetical protein BroJett026_15630 [Betaproteobacteria bacterium]|nr:MAG: hypothetical protein BroJett026_15630 [Betaproteobacteria bacterium]
MSALLRIVALCGCALFAAGCQTVQRTVALSQPPPSGDWAVVEVRSGPVGLDDPQAAMARHGQVIRLEPALARSGEDVCVEPHYVVHAIDAAFFLWREAGVRAADLGLGRRPGARYVEVFCQGRKWRALGGETLHVDDDHVYAVFHAALYRLRRLSPPPG